MTKRRLSQNQRLEQALKITERVFNDARSGHWAFNGKKGLDDDTYRTYHNHVNTVLRKVREESGVGDLFQLNTENVHAAIRSLSNAYTSKAFVHAMQFFQDAMHQSKAVKKPPQVIDKTKILQEFKDAGVIRKSSESTVLKAIDKKTKEVIETVDKSRSPIKDQVKTVLELGQHVGTRIHEAIGMKARDITLHTNGDATVFINGKGNLNRYVHIPGTDGKAIALLQKLKDNAPHENAPVVKPIVGRDGKVQGALTAAKRIERVVETAAEKAGVNKTVLVNGKEVVQRYTPHAARKNFAGNRVASYSQKSMEELVKEKDRRLKGDSKLQEKYRKLVHRINVGSKNEPRTKVWREPNKKELVFFLASHDMGHTRVDVIRFYAEYVTEKAGQS